MADIRDAKNRYLRSLEILDPDKETDGKFWTYFKTGFREKQMSDALVNNYERILYPSIQGKNWRAIDNFARDYAKDIRFIFGYESFTGKSGTSYDVGDVADQYIVLDYADEYDLLLNREYLDEHIALLFDDGDETAKQRAAFRQRVTMIANAYVEGRNDVREIWVKALRMLRFVASSAFISDHKPEIIRQIAKLISVVTQPQHVALAINLMRRHQLNGTTLSNEQYESFWNLWVALTEEGDNDVWGKAWRCHWAFPPPEKPEEGCWRGQEFAEANKLMENMLIRNPIINSDILLRADLSLKSIVDPYLRSEKDSIWEKQSIVELQRFGFARGPNLGKRELEEKTIRNVSEKLEAGAAVGFERGRLPQGLETLIENYLQASVAYAGGSIEGTADETRTPPEAELRRLSDALVRFAQKVLSIANNEAFFARHPESRDGDQTSEAYESRPRDHMPKVGWEDTKEYVTMLLAIGNSILGQADELVQRDTHGQKIRAKAPAEKAALGRALTRTPRQVIDNLIGHFRGKAVAVQAELEALKAERAEANEKAGEAQSTFDNFRPAAETKGTPPTDPPPRMEDASLEADRSVAQTAFDTAKENLKLTEDEEKPVIAAALTILGTPNPYLHDSVWSQDTAGARRDAANLHTWLSNRQDEAANAPSNPAVDPPAPEETKFKGATLIAEIMEWFDLQIELYYRTKDEQSVEATRNRLLQANDFKKRGRRLSYAWSFFKSKEKIFSKLEAPTRLEVYQEVARIVASRYDEVQAQAFDRYRLFKDAERKLEIANVAADEHIENNNKEYLRLGKAFLETKQEGRRFG